MDVPAQRLVDLGLRGSLDFLRELIEIGDAEAVALRHVEGTGEPAVGSEVHLELSRAGALLVAQLFLGNSLLHELPEHLAGRGDSAGKIRRSDGQSDPERAGVNPGLDARVDSVRQALRVADA